MRHYGPLPVWQAAGVLALLVIEQALVNIAFSLPVARIARRSINRRAGGVSLPVGSL